MSLPNILLLMTDQQRFDQLGRLAEDFHTPNLDALIDSGTMFASTYSAGTTCIPSRCGLMTGFMHHRLPRNDEHHYQALPPGFWTLARQLRAIGYETSHIGKAHNHPMRSDHGFDHSSFAEHLETYQERDLDDYTLWLVKQGRADWRATTQFGVGMADHRKEHFKHRTAIPFGYAEWFHPTRWVEREAIERINEVGDSQPHYMVVSFPGPHVPYHAAKEFLDVLDPEDTIVYSDSHERNRTLPPVMQNAIADKSEQQYRIRKKAEIQRRVLTYIRALVAQIDDAIGRILETVDRDNTVIFFTSDHGDYGTRRGLLGKVPWFPFDDLARVPFVCAGPGIAKGKVVEQPVQSFDFVPTALELAGFDHESLGLDGRSLMPLINADSEPESVPVFSATSTGFPAVRVGSKKLIYLHSLDESAVFDLDDDPHEANNLILDDRTLLPMAEDMVEILREQLAKTVPEMPELPIGPTQN